MFQGHTLDIDAAMKQGVFPETQSGYTLCYYPLTDDDEFPELVGIVLCANHARELWEQDPKQRFQVEHCGGGDTPDYCDIDFHPIDEYDERLHRVEERF